MNFKRILRCCSDKRSRRHIQRSDHVTGHIIQTEIAISANSNILNIRIITTSSTTFLKFKTGSHRIQCDRTTYIVFGILIRSYIMFIFPIIVDLLTYMSIITPYGTIGFHSHIQGTGNAYSVPTDRLSYTAYGLLRTIMLRINNITLTIRVQAYSHAQSLSCSSFVFIVFCLRNRPCSRSYTTQCNDLTVLIFSDVFCSGCLCYRWSRGIIIRTEGSFNLLIKQHACFAPLTPTTTNRIRIFRNGKLIRIASSRLYIIIIVIQLIECNLSRTLVQCTNNRLISIILHSNNFRTVGASGCIIRCYIHIRNYIIELRDIRICRRLSSRGIIKHKTIIRTANTQRLIFTAKRRNFLSSPFRGQRHISCRRNNGSYCSYIFIISIKPSGKLPASISYRRKDNTTTGPLCIQCYCGTISGCQIINRCAIGIYSGSTSFARTTFICTIIHIMLYKAILIISESRL